MANEAAIASLQASIANWAAALAADSTTPQPTYSLDGESVNQAEWRSGLLKDIRDAQETIAALDSTWTFLAAGATN